MNRIFSILCVGLLLTMASVVLADEPAEVVDKYSLTLGARYGDFTDYGKKVGEYSLLRPNAAYPDIAFNYQSWRPSSTISLGGGFADKEDYFGHARIKAGDYFQMGFRLRSTTRQLQQDLMDNLETREWLGDGYGGKIATHELQDAGADYSYGRREILTNIAARIEEKHNIRIVASHRSVFKNGHRQAIANNHCFSCHQTSKGRQVDESQHAIEAGLDATVDKFDFGYRFAYRVFASNADNPEAYYDFAANPGSGASADEFASRVAYSDTTLEYSSKPKKQKIAHKFRVKGDVGKGKMAGSLVYNQTENKGTGLTSDAWVGALSYAMKLDPKTRFIGKISGVRIKSDPVYVEHPIYRRDVGGPTYNSSFWRTSSLDRADGKITAEVVRRVNPKITVSLLAGFNRVDRYAYPSVDDNLTSNTFIGQGKLFYRKGMRYQVRLKYRFEKTSDPFMTGRGLFEYIGRDLLEPLPGAPAGRTFYFQREDIRYQSITTEPTDYHEIDWQSTWRPVSMATVNVGAKFIYDKNGDLDSLDVKHTSLQPNLALHLMPNPQWTVTGGFTYFMNTSRGPLAVALFDG